MKPSSEITPALTPEQWAARSCGGRMKILKRVEEGGYLPRGYGIAWRDWTTCLTVTAPIPLNVLLGIARRAFLWLRFYHRPGSFDEACGRMWFAGYDAGYYAGYQRGWSHSSDLANRIAALLPPEVVDEVG